MQTAYKILTALGSFILLFFILHTSSFAAETALSVCLNPAAGVSSHMGLWLTVAAAAVIILIICVIAGKKSQKK